MALGVALSLAQHPKVPDGPELPDPNPRTPLGALLGPLAAWTPFSRHRAAEEGICPPLPPAETPLPARLPFINQPPGVFVSATVTVAQGSRWVEARGPGRMSHLIPETTATMWLMVSQGSPLPGNLAPWLLGLGEAQSSSVPENPLSSGPWELGDQGMDPGLAKEMARTDQS